MIADAREIARRYCDAVKAQNAAAVADVTDPGDLERYARDSDVPPEKAREAWIEYVARDWSETKLESFEYRIGDSRTVSEREIEFEVAIEQRNAGRTLRETWSLAIVRLADGRWVLAPSWE